MKDIRHNFLDGWTKTSDGKALSWADRLNEDNIGIVENGTGFNAYHVYELTGAQVANFQFTTNGTRVEIVLRIVNTDIDELNFTLLRGVELTDGTNIVPARCMNCQKDTESEVFMTSNPTNISGGTELDRDIIFTAGAGNRVSGVSNVPDIRRILARDTNYVLRLSQGGNAGKAIIKIFWAELP